MRKRLSMLLFVVLVTAGLGALSPAAQAADTGNAAPQTGKIVTDEPGRNAPNILDGTVYSIAKVGNTVIVGGQFSQANSGSGTATLTRRGVLAYDATSGKISSTFAPDPLGTVYKVLPASDGKSVYVAGSFGFAGGQSMPSRLFKINVNTGVIDPTFAAPTISGDIRDLDLIGNHLFVAGKFTHINGIVQKALGTVFADTGKRDPYFNSVISGLHRPEIVGAVTDVLQISINKQNNQLMAVGNFTTVDGQARSQIAKFNVGNTPTTPDPGGTIHQTLSTWTTNLFTAGCSGKFDTYMSDVEYSPDGSYFVVSTTGAWGGSQSNSGTIGCDVVARFESNTTTLSTATWTAYTGGDTTWTVEVTDNVVYAGGHQRWQNNPSAGDVAGPGAVSRDGIAALNPVNGMPYSWNPTRARGVGVQDMLATSDALYVGSDTESFGHSAGNTYHARIAVLPLASGLKLPQLQTNALPTTLYRVATGASQLTRRTNFTGAAPVATGVGTAANAANGPGWGTSVGAFMANGVLYKLNTDGSLSKMTFDGTTYGTSTPVNTSDALVNQTDWHTDVKTITSIFYSGGFIYYTKSGTTTANNVLYRRAFEVEDGVVGQQRFTTSTSSVDYRNVRGAFVAGGKMFFASSSGSMWGATWNQAGHTPVTGTAAVVFNATSITGGWSSRAMFPYQATPAAQNEAPVANASISCNALACTFDGTASSDAEGGVLTYDWDFGDGTAHGTGATATHTYANAGDRAVTLIVTDNKGATNATTRTASPSDVPDSISFVNQANNNGNRSNHTIAVPSGTKAGDTLLLFFSVNSTAPVYGGPAGWTRILNETGTSFVGQVYTKTATAGDLGANVTVTSRQADGVTAYQVKSDLTLASYRGLGSPAIAAAASTSQAFSSVGHQTPTLDADDGTSWLVSYWSDKNSTSTPTNWTGPSSQTQRAEGNATGTGHMSSLLADSNKRVGKGGQGGLNATSDTSSSALSMSILLEGQGQQPPNQNPTANATLTGCVDLTCTFDGGSSVDPEGDTLTYDWDWNDGTPHGTTATPSHTFGSSGTKNVTLTVTDSKGATGTDPVTANPTDPPPANTAPTAAITGVSCTNLSCSFDGATSSDPDTDTLTYSWDFGDSTPAVTTSNPTHVYGAAGPWTVTLTVNDGHGHTDTDSVEVTPTPAPNADPVAHITDVTCTDLSCSFKGDTSSDPDNDSLTYSWDFGDSTPADTATNPTHAYSLSGAKTVTLTVSDGHGHTDTDTVQANPTDPDPDPVSNIEYVGSATTNANRTSHFTPLPATVVAGDTLVAFFTAASQTPTYTAPAGWTLIESKDATDGLLRVWTKTATGGETGVTVTSSSIAKSDLTVAAYRGTDGTTPIAASASKLEAAATASHVSPAVTATNDTGWLLTYWADRSGTTTTMTPPAAVTKRQGSTSTGGGHITALFGDSNAPVASGARGQLTATADVSARGYSTSILLTSD